MIVVARAIRSFWRAYQRRIDLMLLWPQIKRIAAMEYPPPEHLDWAKAAFATHASFDSAWADFTEDELIAFIDGLE